MNRRQRVVLIAGFVLLVAAAVCPPWSYYHGEWQVWWPQGVGPREAEGEPPPPPVRGPWMVPDVKPAHVIRGIALLAIFTGTVVLYLKYASPAEVGPGRAWRAFWVVVLLVTAASVVIPFVGFLKLYLTGR
jgi:hypothetical protein